MKGMDVVLIVAAIAGAMLFMSWYSSNVAVQKSGGLTLGLNIPFGM